MAEIKCYDTGEIAINYTAYLKTKHWQGIKIKYRALYINECVMCHTDKYLAIHHMTYENVGNENFDELVFLCKDCHNKLHEALGTDTSKVMGYLRSKKIKPKKKVKPKKNIKTCSTCIDNYRGYCLSGFKKNKNKNCTHHKFKNMPKAINKEYLEKPKRKKKKKIKEE